MSRIVSLIRELQKELREINKDMAIYFSLHRYILRSRYKTVKK